MVKCCSANTHIPVGPQSASQHARKHFSWSEPMAHKSKVSPVLFVITTLCFLFPFVTVSCNGQKVVTFSGVELATGTTVEQPQVFGPPQKRHQGAQPLATVAALCALAGVGLSFLGLR